MTGASTYKECEIIQYLAHLYGAPRVDKYMDQALALREGPIKPHGLSKVLQRQAKSWPRMTQLDLSHSHHRRSQSELRSEGKGEVQEMSLQQMYISTWQRPIYLPHLVCLQDSYVVLLRESSQPET